MYLKSTLCLLSCIVILSVQYVNSENLNSNHERSVPDFEPQVYRNYDDVIEFMENLTNSYPDLASLFFIKGSVQNRNIPVLEITRNVRRSSHEFWQILRQKLTLHLNQGSNSSQQCTVLSLYILLNHSGNESIGLEILLAFSQHLVQSSDIQISTLLNRTSIFIIPILNPDGIWTNSNLISRLHKQNIHQLQQQRLIRWLSFPDPQHSSFVPSARNHCPRALHFTGDLRP